MSWVAGCVGFVLFCSVTFVPFCFTSISCHVTFILVICPPFCFQFVSFVVVDWLLLLAWWCPVMFWWHHHELAFVVSVLGVWFCILHSSLVLQSDHAWVLFIHWLIALRHGHTCSCLAGCINTEPHLIWTQLIPHKHLSYTQASQFKDQISYRHGKRD